MKRNKKNIRNGWQSIDEVSRIIEALMDKDIDPDLKARMQQWFLSDLDDQRRGDAFVRYVDKIAPYTGKLKGDDLKIYNKIAAKLGLKPVPEGNKIQQLFRKPERSVWLKVAAVLLPIITIAGTYLWLHQSPQSTEIIIAKAGYIQSAVLPDGSTVRLERNTEIVYDSVRFAGDRLVKMTGEAVFTVVKAVGADGERLPFTVETDNLTVNVLGTTFRIADNGEGGSGEVALYEGSVRIMADDTSTELKYGNVFRRHHGTKEHDVSLIPAQEMVEHGFMPLLRFEHSSLKNLIVAIRANFGVEFVLADNVDVSRGQYTADFEGVSLEDILTRLTKSNGAFSFRLTGQNVFVTRK